MALQGMGRCIWHPKPFRRAELTVTHARKVKGKKQVAVSRTLIAKKGHESEVASLAGEILKWTAEESQAPGKGIVAFDCVRDGWESNTFHFWERYDTTEAFGDHTTAPRMMELMGKLEPHLEGPVGVALYQYENGMLGPAAIQAGPKGEGGLDDATGASGAAGGASYKQTSRAFDLTVINEHEEAAREQSILASMNGAAGAGAGTDAGAAAEASGSGQQEEGQPAAAAADGAAPEAGKAKARSPLPFLSGFVAFAAEVKERVMAPICRMLKH